MHSYLKTHFEKYHFTTQTLNIYTQMDLKMDQMLQRHASLEHKTRKCCLPNNASIFSAESQAINLALDYIEETNPSKVIIFSDSLSVLQSINNCKIDNSCIQYIILRLHNISHKQIIFCWLLSHVGIRGNEKANKAAKSALSLQSSNLKLPYANFKPAINKYLLNKWQLVWNTAVDNKLHSIKSILGKW